MLSGKRRPYSGLGESYTVAGLIAYADTCAREAGDAIKLADELRAVARRLACPECDVLVTVPVLRSSGRLSPGDSYAQHELTCPVVSGR